MRRQLRAKITNVFTGKFGLNSQLLSNRAECRRALSAPCEHHRRTIDSNPKNAVSISLPRTTKRFPSPRCNRPHSPLMSWATVRSGTRPRSYSGRRSSGGRRRNGWCSAGCRRGCWPELRAVSPANYDNKVIKPCDAMEHPNTQASPKSRARQRVAKSRQASRHDGSLRLRLVRLVTALVIVQNCLRGRFVQFDLRTHFL
jgi:hypothetical protein